ncbi:mannose-1-phosphate guanylyltransferase catalytic subunit beta [Clarias gariepinus]|uniref:glucose-1-phosphate adenylyltransferase n=1 Tax=Clarias gariepinus TaxID=13013 RepID=UPI00234D13FA|nr:glucose-1-phosphate adenylyltransferase [Clarias gariepinus]
MMKAVVLAAGYGTRLQRDIEQDQTGSFGHLHGVAKPLLPVGDCRLISHWLRALIQSECVEQVVVVTNARYYEAFQLWAQDFPSVQVLNDGTRNNEERLGAVACLQLAVNNFAVDDDVIVIGGDTLFKEDFSLKKFTERFSDLQRRSEDVNLVLAYQCKDEETSKYGILEVDSDFRVQCMKEKPQPAETQSRSACPCFYLFSRRTLPLLDVFLKEKETRPLEERDAPGNFLSWLISRRPVYVHEISGRFDVGNLASYTECDRYFREQLRNPDLYLI